MVLSSVLAFSSFTFLLIQIAIVFYFAYILGEPFSRMLILLMFSVQIVFLKISMSPKRNPAFKTGMLVLLVISALLYVGTLNMEHPDWDAHHFYRDVQALRHGQSPYSGELSCKMNQNFVPTFALCAALGDSFGEFSRNLGWINTCTAAVCFLLIAIGLFYFFRKRRLRSTLQLEICLAAIMLCALFYVFFKSNIVMGNISSWVAPFVLLIMGAHYRRNWLLVGFFLAIAVTLKPFLLSVAMGYGIFFLLKKDKHALSVLLTCFVLLVATAIILQLVPGGLGFDTYFEFFTEVIPVRPAGMMANVSNISVAVLLMGVANNLGMGIAPTTVLRVCSVLFLAALGMGVYLARKSREQELPLDHLVYYVMLSTAVSPVLWPHYFSWLIGPAVYLLCKFSIDEENQQLLPAFLLSCIVLTFNSLAWMSALALPIIWFVGIMNISRTTSTHLPVSAMDSGWQGRESRGELDESREAKRFTR